MDDLQAVAVLERCVVTLRALEYPAVMLYDDTGRFEFKKRQQLADSKAGTGGKLLPLTVDAQG
jgi:hypothetical protein